MRYYNIRILNNEFNYDCNPYCYVIVFFSVAFQNSTLAKSTKDSYRTTAKPQRGHHHSTPWAFLPIYPMTTFCLPIQTSSSLGIQNILHQTMSLDSRLLIVYDPTPLNRSRNLRTIKRDLTELQKLEKVGVGERLRKTWVRLLYQRCLLFQIRITHRRPVRSINPNQFCGLIVNIRTDLVFIFYLVSIFN